MRPAIMLCLIALAAGPGFAETPPATQPTTAPSEAPVDPPKAPTEFLTEQQLVQAYRAHQFPLMLKEILRIRNAPLILKNYNKFNVLVLQAEAALQLKNVSLAQQAFKEAADVAPDERKQDLMLATLMLVQKSRECKLPYPVKPADSLGTPGNSRALVSVVPLADRMDLRDLSQRPAALHALLVELLSSANLRVQTAKMDQSLDAMEPAFVAVESLRPVEIGVQGDPAESHKLEQRLGQEVGLMMSRRLKTLGTTARRDEKEAIEVTDRPTAMLDGTNLPSAVMTRGLTQVQAQQLQAASQGLDNVEADCKKVIARLHLDANFFSAVITEAASTKETVEAVLSRCVIQGR